MCDLFFYFSSLKERFVRKQIRPNMIFLYIIMTLYEHKGIFPSDMR